ncbi:AN1-type zinc finger protein 4 isoform X2 [Hemicordylus capensis]|uniref:AN1-type zinc finger protein 4 isoform X2 n=1 Tax=Hemicordylus capensis TaxID=884348 RepID=UPI0023026753|nr:AN1-type zinc finger protein 4 isoform X2 [Hemicordylus capensis]
MASKKEPPFFNEDNMGPFHYKLPFYETMELFIETLTGTCFELRVSPFETVMSVKAKIQRLEGIPVSQQHLIWNNIELEDDYCLNDYNISEGCTLKLILAMRGGPINTRRVPVEDPVREITEYMDPSRDDTWEKGPSSKQVTFLVYREGDQLNFFRVVDTENETLTPLSESLSGSVYNLYADDEDTEASPSGQQIIENCIMMNKMKLLKAKMENINLNKKPKKVIKMNLPPPMAIRPSSSSMSTVRHRFLRALPHIGQSYLPPENSYSSELSQNSLAVLTTTGRKIPSITSNFLRENDKWESASQSQPMSSIRLPSKMSHMEKDAKLLANSMVSPVLASFTNSGKNEDNSASINERAPVLYPDLTKVDLCATEEKILPNTDTFTLLAEANISEPYSELYGTGKVNTELGLSAGSEESPTAEHPSKTITKLLTSAADTILNSHELSPQKNTHLSPLQCSVQMAHHSPRKPHIQSKCFEVGNLRPAASPTVLRSLDVHSLGDSSCPRTSRFHGIRIDSPGKRSDIHSKMESREITEVAIKASKEPVVSVNNVGFLTSLTRSTNGDGLQNSCGKGRFRISGIARTTNLQHLQEESLGIVSPHNEMPGYFLSPGLGLNGNIAAATGKRIGDATYLPPVNASVQTKKKIAKHCFFCGKKTGLATSFECRCGNNFCATHRYAETHTCSYDYKNAGRRYLQESNPVVSAPKLPKI